MAHAQLQIPIKFCDEKFILLQLPLENSSDSLTLFFDTGATVLLLDKKKAERLQLFPNHTEEVAGSSGVTTFEMITNYKLKIAANHVVDSVSVIFDDLSRLNASSGHAYDGIIGNDLLKNYLTTIDLDQKIMTLYPKDHPFDATGYQSIPFTWTDEVEIPHVKSTVRLGNNAQYQGDVLFDSGASLQLLFNTKFVKANQLNQQFKSSVPVTGHDLNGKTAVHSVHITGITLGDFEFSTPMIANFSENESGVNGFPNLMGILGGNIIYRFNQILDYQHQKIYLKPNQYYSKSFPSTVSPFKLRVIDGKLTIESVVRHSNASQKGVSEFDEILQINHLVRPTMHEVNQLLLNQNNQKITLVLKDPNNRVRKVKFRNNVLL